MHIKIKYLILIKESDHLKTGLEFGFQGYK